MDNSAELADLMIGTSDEITQMHKDRKALVTDHLSALVLEGTGPLMFWKRPIHQARCCGSTTTSSRSSST